MRPSLLALCVALACTQTCQASILPYGVQENVDVNTVTNIWDWSIAWDSTYAASGISINDVFAGVSPGDYVMLAAKQVGSSQFKVLAAALESDVRTHTSYNNTHTANGVEWYYNGGSMGFAGLGDTIDQGSADTNGTFFGSKTGPLESDRLSWHTMGGYGGVPTAVDGGWRAGDIYELNDSTDWERFVLVANSPINATVPEPSAYIVFTGLILCFGLAGWWRKQRRLKAIAA